MYLQTLIKKLLWLRFFVVYHES